MTLRCLAILTAVLAAASVVCAAPAPKPEPDLLTPALEGPMKGVDEIVFAARPLFTDPHWYANFSYYAENDQRKAYPIGGRLCRMNLRTRQVTVLLDDPQGGVRDPVVHYDGKKILFAYRKGGTDPYHLYEINTDGTGMRQLTDGPFDDIEPVYLPDGDIVFGSARCKRWVNCWLTQVAILYRCGPNGENIRPISSNNDHDNTPWVLPDGRILYMRWEYTDRSQVHFHHLWTVNPDGTGQMVYYGNMAGGIVMLDSKPVPGSDKVVSIFSPGHGIKEHNGPVVLVSDDGGPDAKPFARTVNGKNSFRDPWAFSEDCFLVASGQGILLMDGQGRTQTLLRPDPPYELHEPRPVMVRPRERIVPPRTDPSKATGTLVLADVTNGRNTPGVRPGEITHLLVLELLPEPIHFSGGMEPITRGGSFMLERILGTVPVEPDGSAHFDVPAQRSVFFVAMDKDEHAVKRMQSFVTVQPGETTGCIGCHERRETVFPPPGDLPMAMRRPPSRIQPVADVPDVFDFPRDIQPILDKHCVTCHNPDKRSGGISLAGDHGPMYSHSYFALTMKNQIADGRNEPYGNRPPRTIGAVASPLMDRLTGKHHEVKASPHELKMVRYWIESGAPYPGTYAAVGSGMVGMHLENKLVPIDQDWPETQAGSKVIGRRCGPCHNKDRPLPHIVSHSSNWKAKDVVFNLTRPAKSLMVMAPLAKEAGGLGTCVAKEGDGPPKPVFANTDDADYQAILGMIQASKRWLDENKRFDMAGFRPYEPYIREMKRYGILPADLAPDAPVNAYDTDRRYWRSFWHEPPTP